MILEVLDKQSPAVFQQDLFSTLVHYYEEILSMSCAGGRIKPKHFKRLMSNAMETAGGVAAVGGEASTTDQQAAAAAAALAAAPAAAAVASASAQVVETAVDAPSDPLAAVAAGPPQSPTKPAPAPIGRRGKQTNFSVIWFNVCAGT